MLKKLTTLVALFVLLTAVLAWTGPVTAQISSQVNTASLRVINALLGLGPVDVFLDGERVAISLNPAQATTTMVIPSGKHTLAVRQPGGGVFAVPIADLLLDLAPNNSKTAIIYQRKFNNPGDAGITAAQAGAIFLIDDDRSPIQQGRTRLTAAHLAMGTPQTLHIGYPSGEPLLYGIRLEQPYGTVDVDAGTYSLAVIDAENPAAPLLRRIGEQNFYAGTLYTMVIVPDVSPGSRPFDVGPVSAQPQVLIFSAPIDPPEQGVSLRVLHAAHNTAVLDIYIDERLAANRLNYGRYTEYMGLAQYSHTITLRRFGVPLTVPPLGRATFTLTAENARQRYWTLLLVNYTPENAAALQPADPNAPNVPVIINTPGGDVLMQLVPDNVALTERGSARVRVLNAADGLPAVRVLASALPLPEPPAGVNPTATPTPLPGTIPQPVQIAEPVAFGSDPVEVEVPAGLYTELNFVPIGSVNPLKTLTNVQMMKGVVYSFVVVGSPSGNPAIDVLMLEDYGAGLPLRRLYLGVITANNANVRAQPSPAGTRVTSLARDTEVEVLGRNPTGEWVRIRYIEPRNAQEQEGWISATAGILRITRLGVPVTIPTLPIYSQG